MNHIKQYFWLYVLLTAGIVWAIWYFFIRETENKIDSSVSGDKKYLIVKAYNPEGGFYWHVYNMLAANHEAKKRNMELVVLFDSGLYLETNPTYEKQYSDYIHDKNWFHYFYQPLGENSPEIKKLIDEGKLSHRTNIRSLSHYDADVKKKTFYEFDRAAFNVRDKDIKYSDEWKECVKVVPHIQEKIDAFYNENMKGYLTIALHRRGTDKYPTYDGSEDNPRAIEYEWIADKIQKWIDKDSMKVNPKKLPIKILVCSDEQPFIDFIKNKFGDKYGVIFTDSIRSSVSTSGKHLQMCKDANDNSPDCIEYKKMKDTSIHRGMKHLSSYKKGEDAVMDVMLMSLCNGVFFRSRGNFSNAVTYANPSLPVIDMVDEYNN